MISNLTSIKAAWIVNEYYQRIIEFFYPVKNEDNVVSVVYQLIKNFGINVTLSGIIEYLKSHTNYPSLKSICDFFDDMNILYYAIRIDVSDIYNLTQPFIAHIKESGGKVLLIYSINKEFVIYSDSLRSKRIMNTNQFLEYWNGVVILIEPTKSSGETNFKEKRKSEVILRSLLPFIIIIFSLSAVFGIYINKYFSSVFSGSIIYLLFTHFAGLVFSALLLGSELNLKTRLTDKLCNISTNADCDAITNSKVSKIFGDITWADVGVIYFTGGLLSLFIFPVTHSLYYLSALAVAALPYPVFSILYQRFKIRKWCPLCLSVQIIILMESLMAFNILKINELRLIPFAHTFIMFAVVFIIELLLKLLFISNREKEHLKLDTLKMKRDSQVFLYKLKLGQKNDIRIDKNSLLFGDLQSKVIVSVFLSFYCSSCAKVFNSILSIIKNNIKIRFHLVFSPQVDEISSSLLKIIIGLNKSGQNLKALELLKSWYNIDKNKKNGLIKFYDIYTNQEELEYLIKYNSSLFQSGKVFKVPSVYVYGYPLPEPYSIDDLKFHITKSESEKEINHNQLIEVEL